MQRIRPAVAKLHEEIGLEHALASERVYTDGAEVIFDYAERSGDGAMLAVVRTGQRQFEQIIRGYLKRISYGGDGRAARLRLPAYTAAQVVVDARQAFGQPLVVHGGRVSRISSTASKPATDWARSQTTSACPMQRSRTSSVSPSEWPPEFFIDRSLGRYQLAKALRERGVGQNLRSYVDRFSSIAKQVFDHFDFERQTERLEELPPRRPCSSQFLEAERGSVLRREGSSRRYFYRFTDPIFQPYVVLNGLSTGLITDEQLRGLREIHRVSAVAALS
jgi:hypothetical protein